MQLIKDGYVYVKEKKIQDKIYWRCSAYTKKNQCHARAHTVNQNIVRKTPHNHMPFIIKKEKIL